MGYILYVYSPSDFVGGLLDESKDSYAAGRGPYKLTLTDDAEPTAIEILDNDEWLQEVDYDQQLASSIELDDMKVAAGTSVNSAYDMINSSTGHQITTLHFGGDGYSVGPVHGLVSTEPMEAGQTYYFDYDISSYLNSTKYEDFVACFTADTLIYCAEGPKRAGDIRVGDRVMTLDDGLQVVRWAGRATVPARGDFAPVEVAPRRLGNRRELRLSPQHRVLLREPGLECITGLGEGLTAVKHLIDGRTVRQVPGGVVTYVHFYFDRHQIVFAEGAPVESFLPEDMALKGLPPEARAEFLALFPHFAAPGGQVQIPVRPILSRREALVLMG